MIIAVDTSAIIAILDAEPEADSFLDVLGRASSRLLSAASFLEAGMVMSARRTDGVDDLYRLIDMAEIEIVAISPADAEVALSAHLQFGRGSGSPAKLNFGDCFAYALAKGQDLPLLFKGDDFPHTDLRLAWSPA